MDRPTEETRIGEIERLIEKIEERLDRLEKELAKKANAGHSHSHSHLGDC